MKGHVLLALNKVDEAETSFDKALELDANLSTAYFGKGRIKSAQKNDKDAIPYFAKAIETAKQDKRIGSQSLLELF